MKKEKKATRVFFVKHPQLLFFSFLIVNICAD